MRKAIPIFIFVVFPLFFSGTTSPSTGALPCNCSDSLDTIKPADSIAKIVAHEIGRVDSAITTKVRRVDSLAQLADSLEVEVMLRARDRNRRRVLGDVDTWREPNGVRHVWRWYYYRYPDGEMRFDTVIKRTYNGQL